MNFRGAFVASFQPETTGVWTAQAAFAGSDTVYECESEVVLVAVEEPSFLRRMGFSLAEGLAGL
jgi:hypothetical protein